MKDSLNRKSYVKNSSRNFVFGILSQAVNILLKFAVRTVFIKFLGEQYLGINGLYTNVLTILSLAECGFGQAIVFSLYKPIVDDDKEKLNAIMQFFKKTYTIIGLIVLVAGCGLIPFLKYLVTDVTLVNNSELIIYYSLFLADTVASYLFFAYKQSFLIADQRSYLISRYEYITNILKSVVQTVLIICFKAFILYLVTQVGFTLIKNILISRKADRLYPFLNRSKSSIDKDEKNRIIKDVRALFLSNIGRVALTGTDNLIISSMISTVVVGIYSNYVLIQGSVEMVLTQVFNSIRGSMGHFFANNDKESNYELFNRVDFANFWLFGFSSIALYTLFNPFISLWIGESYCLDDKCVAMICINFYIYGMLQTLWVVRTTAGLFVQGKYRPLISAVINLVVSILLAKPLGLFGVLLGTFVSRLGVNGWYDPYIIFKHGFNKKPYKYYGNYVLRAMIVVLVSALLQFLKEYICFTSSAFLNFVILMFATALIPNIIFVLITFRGKHFKYYSDLLKRTVVNSVNKIKR